MHREEYLRFTASGYPHLIRTSKYKFSFQGLNLVFDHNTQVKFNFSHCVFYGCQVIPVFTLGGSESIVCYQHILAFIVKGRYNYFRYLWINTTNVCPLTQCSKNKWLNLNVNHVPLLNLMIHCLFNCSMATQR
jgi:hypothetical protein